MPVSRKRPRREPCKTCSGRKVVLIGRDRYQRPVRARCPDCQPSTGKKRNPIK